MKTYYLQKDQRKKALVNIWFIFEEQNTFGILKAIVHLTTCIELVPKTQAENPLTFLKIKFLYWKVYLLVVVSYPPLYC